MKKIKKNKGFTLLIAVVVTSLLLIVSFVVVNVALKELVLSNYAQESQFAFYNAESGVECALYWDTNKTLTQSPFSTGTGAQWGEVYVAEYSGIDTTSPLDKTAYASGLSTGVPNELLSSGSKTVAAGKVLIFGKSYSGPQTGGWGVDAGPGFTPRTGFRGNMEEDKVVNGPGLYDASSYLINGDGIAGDEWVNFMATFKAAAGQTPTFVQNNQNVDSNIISLINPSNPGDLVILNFTYNTQDFIISTITDNYGNSYTRALPPYHWGFNTFTTELWYAKNVNAGPGAVITAHSPAFAPTDIDCNGQHIAGGVGSQTVKTTPTQPSRIGGGGSADPTSIFELDFTKGCAIVRITKNGDSTTIDSRGYNTCSGSADRRLERGVTITY